MLNFISFYTTIIVLIIFINNMLRTVVGKLAVNSLPNDRNSILFGNKPGGFRLCPSAAKTVLDSRNDQGNFLGVAVYVDVGEQEVVLVSEMEAGWYRYISEWRLHVNGTIKPRFGFGPVNNSCVCNAHHHHHVYWRLNFDVGNSKKNIVEEYNNPPLAGRQAKLAHY
jgi:hypothetical protein